MWMLTVNLHFVKLFQERQNVIEGQAKIALLSSWLVSWRLCWHVVFDWHISHCVLRAIVWASVEMKMNKWRCWKNRRKNKQAKGLIDRQKRWERKTERRWERDLRSENEANRVSKREKTELQIKLGGWSSSMLEAFHDIAVSWVRLFTS